MRFASSPSFQNAMLAVSGTGVDFGDLTDMGQKGRSMQQQTALGSIGKLKSAEEQARGMVEAAKYAASATRAQGQAAGQASMFGGMMSGISGLAGGLGSMNSFSYAGGPGSTGTAMGAGGGVVGGYGTLGPNYGIYQG